MLSYFDPHLKGEGDSRGRSGSGAEDKRQVSGLLVSVLRRRGALGPAPLTSSPLKSTSNDSPKPSVMVDPTPKKAWEPAPSPQLQPKHSWWPWTRGTEDWALGVVFKLMGPGSPCPPRVPAEPTFPVPRRLQAGGLEGASWWGECPTEGARPLAIYHPQQLPPSSILDHPLGRGGWGGGKNNPT